MEVEAGGNSYISNEEAPPILADVEGGPMSPNLDEYYKKYFQAAPEAENSEAAASTPPPKSVENDETGLADLLQEAQEKIKSLFKYKQAQIDYDRQVEDITDKSSFERWCQVKNTLDGFDQSWALYWAPDNSLATVQAEFLKRADALLDAAKPVMLEKRMDRVLTELLQAENSAQHGTIGQDGAAMPRDPVAECESRRPFEKSEVDKVCAQRRDEFARAVARHVAEETRKSNAAKEAIRKTLKEKTDLVFKPNKKEFKARLRQESDERHRRNMLGRKQGVEQTASASTNPVFRALAPWISWALMRLADRSLYRRVVFSVGALSVLVLVVAVAMAVRTNERARAWLDHEEVGVSRKLPSGVYVTHLRQVPVKRDYREHYRWMLAQTGPAPSFEEHEMRRGFFGVGWRYGRGYNVTFDDMETWMSNVGGSCVCAQHLGLDRFVAYTKGMMLCDPQIVARAVETTRTSPRDWLDEFSPHQAPKTYHVPKTARVEYTGVGGLAAGRRMSVQLDQVGVACVMRCADWARVETK